MMVYIIENPCLDQKVKKEGHIHGYGLFNVRNCITRYDGTISAEKNDGRYQVVVQLNVGEARMKVGV